MPAVLLFVLFLGPRFPGGWGPGEGVPLCSGEPHRPKRNGGKSVNCELLTAHTSAASAPRLLGSVAARGEGRVAGVGSRLLGSAPVPGDEAGGLQNPTCQGTGRFNTLGAKRSRRIIQIQILLFQLTLIVLPGVTSSFDHP